MTAKITKKMPRDILAIVKYFNTRLKFFSEKEGKKLNAAGTRIIVIVVPSPLFVAPKSTDQKRVRTKNK
jgi:hypothetical protein